MSHVSLTRICSMYGLSYSMLRNSLSYNLFKPLNHTDFRLLTPEEVRSLYEKMMFLKRSSPSGVWRPTVSKDESFRAECTRLKRVIFMRSYQNNEESIPELKDSPDAAIENINNQSSRNSIDIIHKYVKDILINTDDATNILRVICNLLVILLLSFVLFSVCVLYYYFS